MRATRLTVWPPLGGPVRSPAAPFPLDQRDVRLYARARHAVFHGVQALGLRPGDAVLVPAYHHGSEVEALVQAGLRPVFYPSDEALRPCLDRLDDLARSSGARALHLTHFLGFPQDAAAFRAWCDARELLLLEDAAQAFLATVDGRPVGSWGDLAFTCIYKTFGLPDGAAAVCRAPLPPPRSGGLGAPALLRRCWAGFRNVYRAPLWLDRLRRPRPYDAARDSALGDPRTGPSRATTWLLPRVVRADAAERRRQNYRVLLEGREASVPAPFRILSAGAAPMAFPVAVPDRASLLAALHGVGIVAMEPWSVPHPTCPAGFAVEEDLRQRVVALPVHQELRPDGLDRMADALDRALAVVR